ncbi:MAG: hypothetical protein II399_10490, partial [Lachnospiraceae bacterium]|nr:hypothetical protein [Lachnospiraceae bacterium]
QCDEMITEDSFGISFEDLYFCSDTCLHDYVDMMQEPISDRDFELYGEEPDEERETDEEEETD